MSTAINNTLNNVRAQLLKYPAIKKYGDIVEEKTKLNMEYFVVGAFVLLGICLFSGFGAATISNLVGFVYPIYATLVTMEESRKEDDVEWLAYWVVFATLALAENFVDFILYWIPFYYPVKVTFLLWCMLPQYRGAEWTYNHIIKPVFQRHQDAIDKALSSADPAKAVENKEKST